MLADDILKEKAPIHSYASQPVADSCRNFHDCRVRPSDLYQAQQALAREAPPAPKPLETGINGRANNWVYTQSDGEHPRVTVRAKSFRQIKAPSVMELEGVELQLFHQESDQFDLVRSAKAQFDIAGKTLYADGDVEITMARPATGKPTVAPKPGADGEEENPGAHRKDPQFRRPLRQRHRQSLYRPARGFRV